MRNVNALCLLTAIAIVPVNAARATITAVWQRVPITPQAVANDPTLAGMQSWDLRATASGNWSSAGLRAVLPPGFAFYNHFVGGNSFPNPALVAAFPALAYDTYVALPLDNPGPTPIVLGGWPADQPVSMSGSLISVSWGDLVTDLPGTYQIARLTFPLGVIPNVINIADVGPDPTQFSYTDQVSPDAVVEIPDIPEPRAACAVIVAAGALLLRRRTCGPEGKCAT